MSLDTWIIRTRTTKKRNKTGELLKLFSLIDCIPIQSTYCYKLKHILRGKTLQFSNIFYEPLLYVKLSDIDRCTGTDTVNNHRVFRVIIDTILMFLWTGKREHLLKNSKLCKRLVTKCRDLYFKSSSSSIDISSHYTNIVNKLRDDKYVYHHIIDDDFKSPVPILFMNPPHEIVPLKTLFSEPAPQRLSLDEMFLLWNTFLYPQKHLSEANLFTCIFLVLLASNYKLDMCETTTNKGGYSNPSWVVSFTRLLCKHLKQTNQPCPLPWNLYGKVEAWWKIEHTRTDLYGTILPVYTTNTKHYVKLWYTIEDEIVNILQSFIQKPPHTITTIDPVKIVGFDKLNSQQKQAFSHILHHHFTVVTGAGGTGKTELASIIGTHLNYTEHTDRQIVMLAPTGKAVETLRNRMLSSTTKNMTSSYNICTIHRWVLQATNKKRTKKRITHLFIDECSMIDLWTMYHLLFTAREMGVERIILFGDTYQLPPIKSHGTVLDACLHGHYPFTFILTYNFRAEHGLLSLLDHLRDVIDKKMVLDISKFTTTHSEIILVPNHNMSVLFGTVYKCLKKQENPKDVRIITSTRKPFLDDPKCIHSKNIRNDMLVKIHNLFNTKSTNRVSSDSFCTGDIIMSTKNIVEDGTNELLIANGTAGIVQHTSPLCVYFGKDPAMTNERLRVIDTGNIPGEDDEEHSKQNMLRTLIRGTIATVHKFQGSEHNIIIAVFTGDYRDFNTLQLLYTAASRSRRRFILVIEEQTMNVFLNNPGEVLSNTDINMAFKKRFGANIT